MIRRALVVVLALAACTKGAPSVDDARPPSPTPAPSPSSSFQEGADYVVLERVRFLDEMGFDRPVEAFSLLFPRGWQASGGVKWKGAQDCRGELVTNEVHASSPDGAMRLDAIPQRQFAWTDDPQFLQVMQRGPCAINQPFDAGRYIEGYARQDLGASASNIRVDEGRLPQFQQMDQQMNQIARQYGNDTTQTTTLAYGDLTWPDGGAGMMHVGVVNTVTKKPDMLKGGVTTLTTTSVIQCVVMRFPAARHDEAARLLETIMASHRTNPAWRQAKDDFMTRLGNMEHAANMDRIRLAGEASRAYAAERGAAMDRNMRDWESQQASQEGQHKAFVQTIREVETWKDQTGAGVELSSGYDKAWTRGDGSYLLSNKPGFDPAAVLKDDAWTEMQKTKP